MQRTNGMRRIGLTGLCCGIGLMAVGVVAWAQQSEAERAARQRLLQQRAQAQQGEKELCLASDLIGMHAKTKEGQQVGQIANLVINSEGQVQYVAIASEAHAQATPDRQREPQQEQREPQQQQQQQRGAAEATAKLTLVPWELVQLQKGAAQGQQFAMIEIEQQQLQQAPSFTIVQLKSPEGQQRWMVEVDQFFKVRQQRGAARPELNRERQQQQQEQPQRN